MKLWAYPAELGANVFPRTSDQQRTLLLDRRAMYTFASAHGVPVPESREVPGPADLERVGRELGYPFVLRGTQGIGGVQVKIVRDPEQARAAYSLLQGVSPAPPFAQKMIQGRRCLIGGLFDDGRMVQWYSQTTLEANSPPTGPSIRVRSLASPRLTGYTENLFSAFRWTGLACAEFMLDDAGEFYFMEINPRPWAAIQAAHVCGVPLLRSFARFLRDPATPLPPLPFVVGKEVALFPQYFATKVREGPGSVLKSLPGVLSSLSLAPWRHPPAVLHYFRQMWWQRR
jgi:biotin carboxylase